MGGGGIPSLGGDGGLSAAGGGPEAMFAAYLVAFESLNPVAIAGFYNEPALVVTPNAVVSIPTHAVGAQLIAASTGALRERGYVGTDATDSEFGMLAPTLAQCTGVFIRRGEAGELGRVRFTYTLRHSDAWRIAVALTHDA